jgi:hypothetical protein
VCKKYSFTFRGISLLFQATNSHTVLKYFKPTLINKDSKNWRLKFSDEFNFSYLDSNRWNAIESQRGAKHGATTWWRKKNVFLGNMKK